MFVYVCYSLCITVCVLQFVCTCINDVVRFVCIHVNNCSSKKKKKRPRSSVSLPAVGLDSVYEFILCPCVLVVYNGDITQVCCRPPVLIKLFCIPPPQFFFKFRCSSCLGARAQSFVISEKEKSFQMTFFLIKFKYFHFYLRLQTNSQVTLRIQYLINRLLKRSKIQYSTENMLRTPFLIQALPFLLFIYYT